MVNSIHPGSLGRRRSPRSTFSQSPLLVFYEVTRACDLVCDHCRACAQSAPDPGELTTQQSLRLIDELADFRSPPMLVLTGGDPLKRADIYDLVQHAASRRLVVSITPSATPLVTPEALHRLHRAGISIRHPCHATADLRLAVCDLRMDESDPVNCIKASVAATTACQPAAWWAALCRAGRR